MRRSQVVPVAILLFTIFMAVTGYFIYWHDETARVEKVAQIHKARSEIYTHLLIRYDKPPVYEEEYRMQDVEGKSTFTYRIRSYAGKQISITAPPGPMYDVSFFYGKLDQDGVWQIVNQPPRGNTSIHYTVYVKQLVDFKQGERTVTFTDPHWWATTAGRQYSIDLSKNSPKDLLKMNSTTLADPRYQTIVNDFRAFGPESFRKRIAAARASMGL
ncbi:MAG TPA: hypothetical protein VFN49_01565 [Candidatus Aquilonibacter sp.]|nr:hypothetical protein [Candidatus Aquilonibacter sp.]